MSPITPEALPESVHVVADYGRGDLAFAEVVRSLDAHFGHGLSYALASTKPFDTEANGQHLAKLATKLAGRKALVFHNVAPRRDDSENVRIANVGEDLAAAWIGDTLIVGPASGNSWAYVAALPNVSVRVVGFRGKGSQFRSRDYFPGRAAELWSMGPDGVNEYPELDVEPLTVAEVAPMLWEQPAAQTSPLHPPVFTVRDSSAPENRLTGEVATIVDPGDEFGASFCAAQIAEGGDYELAGDTHALIVIDVTAESAPGTWLAKLECGTTVIGPNRPKVWAHLISCGAKLFDASSKTPIEFAADFLANPNGYENLEPVLTDVVPEPDRLCWIDGYGNGKFLLADSSAYSSLEPGTEVRLDVKGKTLMANVAHGSFEVPEGNLALSLEGSSGFGKGRPRFAELFLRGANFAAAAGLERGVNGVYATGQRVAFDVAAVSAAQA